MENESPSTLSVVGCDSGSDKSFDFLGLAKVMECVEKIIETLWDRIVFFRERQMEERLDLVSKALPIIEHINKMEEQKQLEPEMAEILRRNIFDGSNKFIQSGASISTIESRSHYDPRALMSPVQKLLVSAPEELLDATPENSDKGQEITGAEPLTHNLGNLSTEDQELLSKLLDKVRESDTTESKSHPEDS